MGDRRYHRGERGLETQERIFIDSVKMQRLLKKLSVFFGVEFVKPDFRPVYINKRLQRYSGCFYGTKIDIADMGKCQFQKDTLWHELLHGVVSDNYQKVGDGSWKNRSLVEKAVFQLEGNGHHKSFKYQIICDCGRWLKSVKKKQKFYCPRCDKTVISPSQYLKLKKVASVGSMICKVDIDRYKPWKQNKFIGLKNLG